MSTRAAIHSFTPLMESGRLQSTPTREGKLYKDVTLIKAGLGNRRDKNFYTPKALHEAVRAGMFEGLRAFADHPDAISEETQPERSIRDIVGVYTDAKFKEDGENSKVVANLRVLRSAGWLSDMVDELVGMGYAKNVGISINGRGQTVPRTIKATEADGNDYEVHDVQKFVDLRSADIVTEAGAGGGFQQLLESAHRAQEKRPMTIQEMQTLHEAAGKGDADAIKTLLAMVGDGLTECACEEAEAAEAAAKAAKTREGKMPAAFLAKLKKKKKGSDATDDADEEDDTTEADADPSAELDATADALHGDEGADEDDVDDATEADADADDEDDEAPEADEPGGADGTVKAKTREGATTKAKGKVYKGQKHPATKEAATMKEASAEIANLQRRLDKVNNRNARLAEALKVRQQTDRARKLLKESRIPSELQPDLLRRMVGKSEEDMASEVRFTQRLLEARFGDDDDRYDEIEGVSSRVRESGGYDRSDETDTVLVETGLPIKAAKK